MKEIKINLGCGVRKMDGFIGIDKVDLGHNKVVNLETDKLPFEDNSVEYIYARHVVEHLKDVKNCFNECWRVLKPGGIFELEVPYGLWNGAYNPDHYQQITVEWLGWFRRSDNWERYGYYVWTDMKVKEIRNKEGVLFELHATMKPKK